MKEKNYSRVLEVIEGYEDEGIIKDFLDTFDKEKNISKEEFFKFCKRYIDDISELLYIEDNWKFIEKG